MKPSTPERLRTLPPGLAVLLAVAVAGSGLLASRTGLGLFRALASLALWGLLVIPLAGLPLRRFRWRQTLFVVVVLGPAIWLWWPRSGAILGATDASLQLAAAWLGVLSFLFYFASTYAAQGTREWGGTAATFVPFGRLLAIAHAAGAGVVLLLLYFRLPWIAALEKSLLAALAVLVAEALLLLLSRFYQPGRVRNEGPAMPPSVLLPALFGESGPIRSLVAAFERTFGVRLAEVWLVRFARGLVAPLLLAGALGLWLSTAVTRVPVDGSGVLLVCGEFQPEPLPPGLHFHAPWPWASVIVVQTGRVQEISLGFERDLASHVLWAEKHFEGEQNLLVGSGEELLTVNVPVQFRVRDAVAHLRSTSDPAAALTTLGYRQLLGLASGYDAFALMTTDRASAAEQVRAGLQDACDRLGLGLEIVFTGFKDVHPPVAVAPAYQDVVSAEEERVTLIDQAHTYAVQALSSAGIAASLARVQADTAATARREQTAGAVSRFLAPLASWQAHPEVFSTRLRLETLESTLPSVPRLYVLSENAGGVRRSVFLGAENIPVTR